MIATISKIEELTRNFDNIENRRTLMREYGDFPDMLFGTNSLGERTAISINTDNIVVVTYQSNGYIRKNIYDESGYVVEELYER
jgi:hypothetical protein